MTRRQLLRLGLFQLIAGGLSVLFLGVLNRILRVELGMDLFLVSLLIGAVITSARWSQSHSAISRTVIASPATAGRHISFSVRWVTALVLALSPWVAVSLADAPTSGRIAAAFSFFLLEGISTFIAGTAYLALIADRPERKERGQATGLV